MTENKKVIIAKIGKPITRLIPVATHVQTRKPGALKNKIVMANDFNAPLSDDLVDPFEGK